MQTSCQLGRKTVGTQNSWDGKQSLTCPSLCPLARGLKRSKASFHSPQGGLFSYASTLKPIPPALVFQQQNAAARREEATAEVLGGGGRNASASANASDSTGVGSKRKADGDLDIDDNGVSGKRARVGGDGESNGNGSGVVEGGDGEGVAGGKGDDLQEQGLQEASADAAAHKVTFFDDRLRLSCCLSCRCVCRDVSCFLVYLSRYSVSY